MTAPNARPGSPAAKPTRSRLDHTWLIQAALFACFTSWAIGFAATNRIRDVYLDEWLQLSLLSSKPYLQYLFTPHNGHQIPILKLLLDGDALLGTDGALPFVLTLSFLALSAWVVLSILRRSEDTPLRRSAWFFICSCLVWASFYYGLVWRFALHAPLTILAFLVATLGLIKFATATDGNTRGHWLTLSLFAAVVSTFSCATGMATWGALVAIALISRLHPAIIAVLLAGLLASTAMLVLGGNVGIFPAHSFAMATLQNPAKLVEFVCKYVGIPVGQVAEGIWSHLQSPLHPDNSVKIRAGVGLWAGALAIAGAAIYAIRQLLSDTRDPLALLSVALFAFGIGAAVITAPVRVGISEGQEDRFTLFSITVWIGWVTAATVSSARVPVLRRAIMIALPCVTLAMLPAMRGAAIANEWKAFRSEQASVALSAGILSESGLTNAGVLGWTEIQGVLPILERTGRGPYADPRRHRLGQPLSEIGEVAPSTLCEGRIRKVEHIVQDGNIGARITGTLRTPEPDSRPRFVWTSSPTGVVTGLGTIKAEGPLSWYAYIGPADTMTHSIFVQLSNDAICRLGRISLPAP